jgi:hypothetical protein
MFKIFHDTESLQNEITAPYMEELTKRFLEYVKVSKTFIVEEKYIDKEWRVSSSIARGEFIVSRKWLVDYSSVQAFR